MKRNFTSLLLALPFAFVYTAASAQTTAPENPHTAVRCATEIEFNEHAKNDPSAWERRNKFEADMAAYEKQNSNSAARTTSVPRVIPVVVHVLHQCGPENISKEQILDEIRILNEDFRKLNADTTMTPIPFRSIAADCNVEFRLAQIDPNGNCTDGIERIESIRTNTWNPRDSLKNVSHWPSDKYLNIWTVRGIYDQNGAGGTILGYAQFPWDLATKPTTDGVVIRHDYFGSIGTAAGSGNAGRVSTHEIGHWLGLLHIWGDDATSVNGPCSGSDQVGDTPNEEVNIFGCPSTFPYFDACTATGNGIMYMNYMDYTDGVCQNIYTNGQKTRMDNVFNLYRSTIITNANLIATGTDGTPPVVCTPIPAVCQKDGFYVCAGNSIAFNSVAYNADTITYSWDFPGGTPSTSTDADPVITYATPGLYGYKMVVSSSAGSDSIQYNNAVTVQGPATIIPFTISTKEDFELASSFPGDGYVVNGDNGVTWQRVTNAGFSGVASLKMNNYTNVAGEIDDYVTPAFDIQYLTAPQMKFRVANAQRSATSADKLSVDVTVNCGATWTNRYGKAGSQLATAGVLATSFTPTTASQWRLETVNPSASGATNVRFRFRNESDHGNNTYVDDINITAISVGVAETIFESSGFHVYPNPASGTASVTYNLAVPGEVTLSLVDLLGREVKQVVHEKRELGIHLVNIDLTDLNKGIYFVTLRTENSTLTNKLIVQ